MKCVTIIFCLFIVILTSAFFSYLLIFQFMDIKVGQECFESITGLTELEVKRIMRDTPDSRDYRCPRRFELLDHRHDIKVSIIITYHNESLSMLLATIHSIYQRTPLQYLQEIILIDDCSENDFVYNTLVTLNKGGAGGLASACLPFGNHTLLPLRSIRNSQRLGLIESRNIGARMAYGNYLVFMDSHCEVNQQWLESLLHTILKAEGEGKEGGGGGGGRIAVSPLLDNIDVATRQYKTTEANIKGGFDWNLHFHWIARDKMLSPFETFRSPTFAGGVFLISRNWFFKLKAFNTRLEIWGGESLEFSLKLWLCGGEIRIVPCSRVGHVFRKQHIFKFPDDDRSSIYLRNSKIIAETWLDEYKYYFYNLNPEARHVSVNLSRSENNVFKESLKCQNFDWYLTNVFPELRKHDNFTAAGTLSAYNGTPSDPSMCIHHDNDTLRVLPAVHLRNCLLPHITKWFLLRSSKQIQSNKGLCLSVARISGARSFLVVSQRCMSRARQKWHRQGLQLRNLMTGLCLETIVDYQLVLSFCRRDARTQDFRFSQELEVL